MICETECVWDGGSVVMCVMGVGVVGVEVVVCSIVYHSTTAQYCYVESLQLVCIIRDHPSLTTPNRAPGKIPHRKT